MKKIVLFLGAFLLIGTTAQAQCNASNSPTFQVTTSAVAPPVNGFCHTQINIVNANTTPAGGPVSFCIMAPGQPTMGPACLQPPGIATAAGVYTVEVKDNSNFCVTSQTVQINILPAPPVSAVASNTLVCSGSVVTLTASGANSYTWNTGATTASISITPGTFSTYSVTGTGTNGCSNTASVAVNVNPLPNVTATANQNSICVNQTIQLTAQGANTYTWNSNATGSQYTTSAFTTTGNVTYTVQLQGTGNAGCIGTNIVSVAVLVQTCETVGIAEYSNSDQSEIYPNPVSEILSVEFENINAEIKIFDLSGKEMLSVKNTKQINVSELPKGVYFIKMEHKVRKFLKE